MNWLHPSILFFIFQHKGRRIIIYLLECYAMFLNLFIDVLADNLCLKRINCVDEACIFTLKKLCDAKSYSEKFKIIQKFLAQIEKEVGIIFNNSEEPRFFVKSIEMFHYDENSNIDDDDFFQRRSDYWGMIKSPKLMQFYGFRRKNTRWKSKNCMISARLSTALFIFQATPFSNIFTKSICA